MESANMGHQHQLQEQLGGSSSLAVPSFNGVGIGHFCNQNISLNGGSFNSNLNGTASNTRDVRRNGDILVHPSINTSMFQDLGFHWSGMENYSNYEANEVQFAKLKGQSSDSYPKFCDPSILEEQLHLPSTRNIKQEQQYIQDLNEKLFLKNFSSGYQINGLNLSSSDFYSTLQSSSFGSSATPGRGNFSRVHPSSNISSLNSPSSSISSSLDMNLQSLDLFASTKVGANFSQPLLNNLASFKAVPLGFDHLQDSSHGPANNCQMTSFMNGAIETKRGLDASETKPCQPPPKKPRFESRSLPPIKVRKEKLGDRIAALQQLVAPFGKTDTASVLLEAIGYIKFLQDQVETLSVPYMKNNNGSCTTSQQSLGEQESKEEPKRDLRSRGLCLVPLSCTSYVTNDNASVWSPPNYRGGT